MLLVHSLAHTFVTNQATLKPEGPLALVALEWVLSVPRRLAMLVGQVFLQTFPSVEDPSTNLTRKAQLLVFFLVVLNHC